jgi:hypothetical protein
LAIAEPIPPDAPVTNAVIPERSNMLFPTFLRHSSESWNLSAFFRQRENEIPASPDDA